MQGDMLEFSMKTILTHEEKCEHLYLFLTKKGKSKDEQGNMYGSHIQILQKR